MLPAPSEQQEQLLQMLDGMPPVEHESFLGHWLYLLVQVHHAYLVSHYTRHPVWSASSAQGCPPRLWQGVYPEARVGKLTGMLLEQDVDQIVPLFCFPKMVRSNSPSSSPAVACMCPPARLLLRGATAAG